MKSFPFRLVMLIMDQLMLVLSFLFTFWLSYHSGLSSDKPIVSLIDNLVLCIVFNGYWLLVFALFGLYGKWKNTSRFDEIISAYKTITIGAIVFIIIAFLNVSSAKLIVMGYWASLIVLAGAGRLIIRTFQRMLLLKGIGLRPSIIVGTVERMAEMVKNVRISPALGYDIVGVVPRASVVVILAAGNTITDDNRQKRCRYMVGIHALDVVINPDF